MPRSGLMYPDIFLLVTTSAVDNGAGLLGSFGEGRFEGSTRSLCLLLGY
jgi:hypothetical protein